MTGWRILPRKAGLGDLEERPGSATSGKPGLGDIGETWVVEVRTS
jgi:hypothetical protein